MNNSDESDEPESREELKAKLREQKRQRIDTAVNGVVSNLTAKQREFLIYYLLDGNATKAAEMANYAHPNSAGPRLLTEDKIKVAVETYFHTQEMSAKRAVALLSEKAGFDPSPYLRFVKDNSGRITDAWLDLEAIRDDGLGHVIKGIKYSRQGQLYAELDDKLRALEDVIRIHGMFGAKGTDDDPINVLQKITTIIEERDADDGNGPREGGGDEAED